MFNVYTQYIQIYTNCNNFIHTIYKNTHFTDNKRIIFVYIFCTKIIKKQKSLEIFETFLC